tara:strand:+ start:1631 stop:2350 length:720 start_codon:yes stop_codon:yes gene_type:complete
MSDLQNNDSILKELNGSYQISTLKGEDVSSFNLNMAFNDSTKQVSGFSGCNRFNGSYTLENNTLKFSELGTTRMFCTKDKNDVEYNLLKTFGKANLIGFTKNGFSIYNKKKLLLSASKEIEEVSSIEYTASSRGTYKQIIINKKTISTVSKRGGKSISKNGSTDGWERIIKALKYIQVENISELEPPSKDFQFDGAAIARLKITSAGKDYETQSFDHGNPPEELAELVKEILSISENIE